MNYINIIFFGRLDVEKGCNLLLNYIKLNNKKVNFHVFGTGEYSSEFLKSAQTSDNIFFYGRKNREDIKRQLLKSHYSIIPSQFLETFGLTALESISLGVPVICPKKGGLEQFVLDDLIIDVDNQDTFNQNLNTIINTFSIEKHNEQKTKSLKIAQGYTKEKRTETFIEKILSKNKKKISIISDYKSIIGGIESSIYAQKDHLETIGYVNQIYGLELPTNKKRNIIKKFLLPCTAFNLYELFSIYFFLRKTDPDLIRSHSIVRYIGWLPIVCFRLFKAKKAITYHDFGFFHPFPHTVFSVSNLPLKRSYKEFILSGKTYNPITLILITFKFILLSIIRQQVKHFDIHIVPSFYMVDILSKLYNISKENIVVLPFFPREN